MASAFMTNPILKANTPDLLRDLDLTNDELAYLLDLAADVKQSPARLRARPRRSSPSPCCSKSHRCAPRSPLNSP